MRRRSGGGRRSTETSVLGTVGSRRGVRRSGAGAGGLGGCRDRGAVYEGGVLGAAGVVGAASVGAGIVLATGVNALVTPFLADEEGDGLRVFGDVGGDSGLADAAVGEVLRFTGVRLGGGVVTGVLEADQRALGHLLLTPELPEPERDGIRVDVVLLLGEGGGDEGEDAEGQ